MSGPLIYLLIFYSVAGLTVNLAYHRVLSHRSVTLSLWLERLLVTLGLPAGTPVQWVGNHRFHHLVSDQAEDPHSPYWGGFWHAHVGWYIGTKNPLLCALYAFSGPLRTLLDAVIRPRASQKHNHLAKDIERDGYYRLLGRPGVYLGVCILHVALFAGVPILFWGWQGAVAAYLAYMTVYNLGDSVDSLAHLFGSQPFKSAHMARNNWILGYIALGEGWHANHHEFPASARHGLLPGQLDWTWLVIRCLMLLGLARDPVVPADAEVRSHLLEAA